jgi:3-oxoacyl-[acyl-carrier protein] reductase
VRNVVVTGGTRGLGLATALTLAGAGYRVIAIARAQTPDFTRQLHESASATPDCLHFRAFDLNDLGSMPELVAGLVNTFGPLYGLINNAGLGTSGILATMPERDIAALLHLNVASPIALTKYVVRAMMVSGGGRIVNMSSIVAATGYTGLSVYAATKAALVGFSRSMARELGPLGITVNSVAPGFIDTEMTQSMSDGDRSRVARRSALRRLADADDVAGAVLYLLSDHARNVTGITLTVDAGNTA